MQRGHQALARVPAALLLVPGLAQRFRGLFQHIVVHPSPLFARKARSLRLAWNSLVRTVASGTPTILAASRELRSSTSQSTKATRCSSDKVSSPALKNCASWACWNERSGSTGVVADGTSAKRSNAVLRL